MTHFDAAVGEDASITAAWLPKFLLAPWLDAYAGAYDVPGIAQACLDNVVRKADGPSILERWPEIRLVVWEMTLEYAASMASVCLSDAYELWNEGARLLMEGEKKSALAAVSYVAGKRSGSMSHKAAGYGVAAGMAAGSIDNKQRGKELQQQARSVFAFGDAIVRSSIPLAQSLHGSLRGAEGAGERAVGWLEGIKELIGYVLVQAPAFGPRDADAYCRELSRELGLSEALIGDLDGFTAEVASRKRPWTVAGWVSGLLFVATLVTCNVQDGEPSWYWTAFVFGLACFIAAPIAFAVSDSKRRDTENPFLKALEQIDFAQLFGHAV